MINTELLKETIKESGIKNAHLASKLGISPQAFYKKINGPSMSTEDAYILKRTLRLDNKKFCQIFFAQPWDSESHEEG